LTIGAKQSESETSKILVLYKVTFAPDPQREPMAAWQAVLGEEEPPPPPNALERKKWAVLTVAPPMPSVTPVGRE